MSAGSALVAGREGVAAITKKTHYLEAAEGALGGGLWRTTTLGEWFQKDSERKVVKRIRQFRLTGGARQDRSTVLYSLAFSLK